MIVKKWINSEHKLINAQCKIPQKNTKDLDLDFWTEIINETTGGRLKWQLRKQVEHGPGLENPEMKKKLDSETKRKQIQYWEKP